jgi:hypothetical protein
MKDFKNIFTLLVVALIGLSLTGCNEDDLDTNPYNKSGVNLLAFGPAPILRNTEIRITGTNLTNVDKVIFPHAANVDVALAEVEKANFNHVDNENIYVNIPDETVPGNIRLVAGRDTITSEGILTYKEPIEVTSISPVTGLNAGDEISIKGDYVYNIAEVIFTSGVSGAPVLAEEFTYVSRREIRLRVPLAAESGVISFNDGGDWEFEFETPITILTASITGLDPVYADFGQQIKINGVNLHTVESVYFGGAVSAEFTVSSDNKTITATVPAECKSGAISLVLYSGAALMTDEFAVPTISFLSFSKTKDIKVGDVITITGENLDRISSISLPGYGILSDEEYTISGNTLTFTVPEGMTDGKMLIVQNSFISIEQGLMMYSEAPEIVIWAGSKTIGNWDGSMGDLSWGGYDWSTVQPGQVLSVYLTPDLSNGWSQIRFGNGSWAALPSTGGEIALSADMDKVTVALTQADIDELVNNGGLVLCGAYYTVTKVTLSVLETVLWKGELGPTNWNGDKSIMLTDDMKAELQAGRTMGIEFKCDEGGGQVEICGTWWTGLEGPKLVYGTNGEGRAIMDFPASTTKFEWPLNQGDIDILLQQGGILFVGNGGLTITKWYVK